MSTERSNAAKETVLNAVTKLFIEQDPAAVENHFGPAYTQHSTHDGVVDGVEGLARLARDLPPGFRYEPVRILAEDGLVVLHAFTPGSTLNRSSPSMCIERKQAVSSSIGTHSRRRFGTP